MNEFHPPLNKYRKFKIFITKTTFHIIIASSSAVKESITNTGICSEKIEIIYNALDTKHLQIFNRINFTNNKDQKVILMFGWTYYRKGVDIAINAVRELVNEGQNIRLVIAMAGGLDVIENEIISQLGSVPSWITLQGPTHNVASYYNSSDIFLSSSREEGFTYSVLEAAYCNPMIIASEIGGHPLDIPFISHFESGNVNQLKALIIEILEKSLEEKLKIKTMQKKYVITNYNINKWSESVLEVYSKLLN
jgi:glycosyltransferase involved in cell wall biosynthesis